MDCGIVLKNLRSPLAFVFAKRVDKVKIMNQQDLEFANYYIDCLLKKHPKAISPSYKKYSNAYNVIQELKHDGIIERKGSNFIINSIYYHDIKNHGSYNNYLHSITSQYLPIDELNSLQKNNLKKILVALSEKNEVTLQYAKEILRINNNDAVLIFNYLIENDLVHNLRTKQGSSIGIKIDIDYLALSELVLSIKTNAAPSNNPDKKSRLKKFFSNPYVIGLTLICIEEITLGKIWRTICSLIN